MKHVLIFAVWMGLYLLVAELLFVFDCDQNGLSEVRETCSRVAKHSLEGFITYAVITLPILVGLLLMMKRLRSREN